MTGLSVMMPSSAASDRNVLNVPAFSCLQKALSVLMCVWPTWISDLGRAIDSASNHAKAAKRFARVMPMINHYPRWLLWS